MRDVNFEIVEHITVLSEHPNGWKKELNKVAWNGNAPKYEIRSWDAEHEHMSRGLTLTEAEAANLAEALFNPDVDPGDDEDESHGKCDNDAENEPDEPTEVPLDNVVSIKQQTGVMDLDLAMFIQYRPLKDIGDLVRKVIKPAVNRDEVIPKVVDVAKRIIKANKDDTSKNSLDKLKRATRTLELVAPLV